VEPEALRRLTHRTIKGVTEDVERFRFNTAISKLQVLSNEVRSSLRSGGGARRAAEALVQMLAPFAPFAAEELWRQVLGHGSSVHVSSWPEYDPSLAADETVTLIVQVDGKLRDKVEVPPDADDAQVLEIARSSESVRRAIDGRDVAKEIVRPPGLVNFVTKR
jgi:leucyl-tRNA synthetase